MQKFDMETEQKRENLELTETHFIDKNGLRNSLEMFSHFVVEIGRDGEKGFIQFICNSNEGDVFIEHVIPSDIEMKIHRPNFLSLEYKEFYRGIELSGIEENLSIALNEYLRVHDLDEGLISINEHLASILLFKNVESRLVEAVLETL